jgi:hypothetical protein
LEEVLGEDVVDVCCAKVTKCSLEASHDAN